jgi:hypothetical protein
VRDRSRSTSRRPQASSTRSVSSPSRSSYSRAAAAPMPQPTRRASRWPAMPGCSAGATSACVPSTAPTTGRTPVRPLDALAELVGQVGPEVGVVDRGAHGDPRAVHREHHHRRQRLATAVGGPGVDPQQAQPGVDRHVGPLAPRAPLGDAGVAHVRGQRAVAGEAPHVGGAPGQPGRPALLDRPGGPRGDAGRQPLRPRRVEPGLVGGEPVVEVGAEDCPAPRGGCGWRRGTPRPREHRWWRPPRGPRAGAPPQSRPAGRTGRPRATRWPTAGGPPGPAAASATRCRCGRCASSRLSAARAGA